MSVHMDDRKRNSLWDVPDSRHNYRSQKDHNSTGDGWRHTLSPTVADNNLLKPKDGSKWSSRERSDSKNSVQTSERVYDDSHREWGQRKYNHSPDDLDKSRRYLEQSSGRSRSRDRGRTRGRSHSRSRGGDLHDWSWNRSTSRSRSPSRSKNQKRARSRTRSRSPPNDHRHDAYVRTDRNAPRPSSNVCRDFATGMCRRGSQCRFLHPDNVISGDGNSIQDDSAERSRNRPELGHTERYLHSDVPGGYSRGKVYDSNYGDDERLQSRNRGTITCREFLKGNCKWGASCRFSHHVPSGDNNVRKTSFDHDHEPQHQETGKTVCRYFLAGTCQRVSCKFSHHVPSSKNHDERPRDENIAWHDGRTWDEVGDSKSKKTEATDRSKHAVTNAGSVDVDANIRTDDLWGQESNSWIDAHSEKNDLMEDRNVLQPLWNRNNDGDALIDRCEDLIPPDIKTDDQWCPEAKNWVGVQSENSAAVDDRITSHHPWNKNNDGGTGSIVSMVETFNDEYEDHVTSQNLHPGDMSVVAVGQNAKPGSSIQNNDAPSMHVQGSLGSDVEHKNFGEDSTLMTYTFDRHDAVMDPGIAINPLVPGDNNESGVRDMLFDHLVSKDHKDTYNQNPSNEQNFSLSSAGQLLHSLNMSNQNSYQKEVMKAPEMQKFIAPQSFRPESSFSQAAQIAYHDASATQKLVSEQVEPHPRMPNNFISTGFVPSAQSLVPPVHLMYHHSNIAMRPPESYNILGDGRDSNATNFRSAHLPYPFEKHDEMILEPFSPPSNGNPVLEPFSPPPTVKTELEPFSLPPTVKIEMAETISVGNASLQLQDATEANQPGATVGKDVLDIDKTDVVICKDEQENTNKESANGNDKAEPDTNNKQEENNKEEKEMRLFKNALVELVKDVLKPRWKEGRMSREVHKTIVKKVVDKVSSTIQVGHIPKTKDKVDQYLSSSKPKISKLVQAYVERHAKAES